MKATASSPASARRVGQVRAIEAALAVNVRSMLGLLEQWSRRAAMDWCGVSEEIEHDEGVAGRAFDGRVPGHRRDADELRVAPRPRSAIVVVPGVAVDDDGKGHVAAVVRAGRCRRRRA